jgi:hypothetical protein
MEYKFVELMSIAFERSPEQVVQDQITYRYNAVKVCFLLFLVLLMPLLILLAWVVLLFGLSLFVLLACVF